jgi:hypothetical protein
MQGTKKEEQLSGDPNAPTAPALPPTAPAIAPTAPAIAPAIATLSPPAASPEEAAAIVAAIERFMRATAPGPAAPVPSGPDPWLRAAILEGVARADGSGAGPDLPEPWITDPG